MVFFLLREVFCPQKERISVSKTTIQHSWHLRRPLGGFLTPHQASPAFVAAADQVVLLHAVGEKLRATKGEADFGQELG